MTLDSTEGGVRRSTTVKTYEIMVLPRVAVRIIITPEGKYRYIVEEPQLNERAKEILERVRTKILKDVELLQQFAELTSLDDGLELAMKVVRREAKKDVKRGVLSDNDVASIAYYIARDFVGYGPIDPLIRDPHIEDITCDGVEVPIYVFHNEFEWIETNVVFKTSEELEKVIRKLAYRAGIEPTIAQPIVEGVIKPEGYRVHIVLDVVSRRGHTFTIRRFRESPFTIVELISRGMLDPGLAALLWLVAESKQGIVIYGPTGAGKTTLLNAIAMLLPPEVKIVVAEDTPEITLPFHENWVAMVTRLSSDRNVQSVTLQMQVESAMRQRPDILILGEIRSREAYSFFQAVSTGHGGLTTVHAESVEALIRRLTSPPMNVPKALIATTRLFVQVLRLAIEGTVHRKIVVVHEVDSYDPSRDVIRLRTVSKWDRASNLWLLKLSGSTTLSTIANLAALPVGEIVEDLLRRATLLWYATKKNLDIVSLYALIRRYKRDPEVVYREIVKILGDPYEVHELKEEEIVVV